MPVETSKDVTFGDAKALCRPQFIKKVTETIWNLRWFSMKISGRRSFRKRYPTVFRTHHNRDVIRLGLGLSSEQCFWTTYVHQSFHEAHRADGVLLSLKVDRKIKMLALIRDCQQWGIGGLYYIYPHEVLRSCPNPWFTSRASQRQVRGLPSLTSGPPSSNKNAQAVFTPTARELSFFWGNWIIVIERLSIHWK